MKNTLFVSSIVLTALAPSIAVAGKYDFYHCTSANGTIDYSIYKCQKGQKQERIEDNTPPRPEAERPPAARQTTTPPGLTSGSAKAAAGEAKLAGNPRPADAPNKHSMDALAGQLGGLDASSMKALTTILKQSQ